MLLCHCSDSINSPNYGRIYILHKTESVITRVVFSVGVLLSRGMWVAMPTVVGWATLTVTEQMCTICHICVLADSKLITLQMANIFQSNKYKHCFSLLFHISL